MDKTLEALIVDVQSAIYQSAGVSTQVYSQDIIANMITDGFIFLASDVQKDWKRFKNSVTYTLDGTTGRTTVPISNTFKNYDDIQHIFIGQTERMITAIDLNNNPSMYTGDAPLGYLHDTTDTIRIIPASATGTITINGIVYPTSFILTDIVPFDHLALKYYVAWQYMTDDGSNPGAAEKLRVLFEARYKNLGLSQDQAPVALNGAGMNDFPREWWGYS